MAVLVYDGGLFTDNISAFPLWDDGTFLDLLIDFLVVDAGIWYPYLGVSGVDLSMIDIISDIVSDIPYTSVNSEALLIVQNTLEIVLDFIRKLSFGLPIAVDPTLAAIMFVTKGLLAARLAMTLTSNPSVIANLELQSALLARAHRLLQQGLVAWVIYPS